MSLFLKKFVRNAAIGIWEINESVEQLYGRLKLSEEEENVFASLKTPTRKQHWLAYRLILPYLVRENELTSITYDEYGKPYLNNGVRHISVSHSGKYSALIASPDYTVGIDIEKIEDKIHRVKHKFLNDIEISEVKPNLSVESLYIIWAAKEALYKLHGKRDILFREHIYIEPFDPEEQGIIYGTIKTDYDEKIVPVSYQLFEDYILAYALDR
ncbi:MAG: 4'-phosphopantetheinyl transferase family protein [Bacteroidales bacterium]